MFSNGHDNASETKQRLSWTIGSRCLIYSRSKSKWMEAEITGIKGTEKDEWLIVKYTDTKDMSKRKKKEIQRYCKDIKPNDAYFYQLGSKCQIYSELTCTWCNGEVISIFNDSEGEWLSVKYPIDYNEFVVDIQRYSRHIKLINSDDVPTNTPELSPLSTLSNKEMEQKVIDNIENVIDKLHEMEQQINTFDAAKKKIIKKLQELPDNDEKTDGVCIGLTEENGPTKFKLIKKTKYNHDCIIFRFELQTKDTILGLPIGNHVRIKWEDNTTDWPISRPYTPISDDSAVGYFELLIKIYPNGELTQFLSKVKVNEFVEFEGPLGMICYEKANLLRIKKFDFDMMKNIETYLNVKKIGMLAGGTGINPMYQIIKSVHKNKVIDDTKISLVLSNKTECDILLKDTLDAINNLNENINVFYTISNTNIIVKDNWEGRIGRIDVDMIKKNIFPPNDDVAVLLCGSRAFNQNMKQLCQQIGYKEANVLAF